jgi:hypothetical protein
MICNRTIIPHKLRDNTNCEDIMKILAALLLLLTLLFPTSILAKSFGNGITVKATTLVSEILDHPKKYVGKQVKVEGLIVDVCASRGCWVYIAGDRPFDKLRIKVVDGEIVFPMEARGRKAEVEGVVEIFELTKEQVIEKRMHHALEQGEIFDPATITSGETIVRLHGLGAQIPGL